MKKLIMVGLLLLCGCGNDERYFMEKVQKKLNDDLYALKHHTRTVILRDASCNPETPKFIDPEKQYQDILKKHSVPSDEETAYHYQVSHSTVTNKITCQLCRATTEYIVSPVTDEKGEIVPFAERICPDNWITNGLGYWHKECWEGFFGYLKDDYNNYKNSKSFRDHMKGIDNMLPNTFYIDQFGRPVSKEEFDKIGKTEVIK